MSPQPELKSLRMDDLTTLSNAHAPGQVIDYQPGTCISSRFFHYHWQLKSQILNTGFIVHFYQDLESFSTRRSDNQVSGNKNYLILFKKIPCVVLPCLFSAN